MSDSFSDLKKQTIAGILQEFENSITKHLNAEWFFLVRSLELCFVFIINFFLKNRSVKSEHIPKHYKGK